MEYQFEIVAIIAVVVMVALGLAFASNRAEQVEPSSSRKKAQKTNKDQKQKPSKKNKSSKASKNVKEVVFGAKDGKRVQPEDEDESMLELIQGTSKYYAKEAKEAAAALKKAAQTEVTQVKKAVQKKLQPEEHEDNSSYVAVNRSRKAKTAADQADTTTGDAKNVADQAGKKNKGDNEADGERKRRAKPFLKSDIPPPREARKPGDKPRTRRERPDSESDGATGASDDNNERPRRQRAPRSDSDSNTEASSEGDEDRRPRQPRGPPKEPRERKPREVQPLPAPLAVTSDDTPSLDAMLGAITSHYGTTVQKNLFTALAEKEKDRTRTKRRDITSATGRSILIGILSYLPLRDIASLARVNNFFSKFTRDDQLWKNLCQRDFKLKFGKGSERKKFKPIYRDEFDKAHGRVKPAAQNAAAKVQKQDAPAAAAPVVAREDAADTKPAGQKKSAKKPKVDS